MVTIFLFSFQTHIFPHCQIIPVINTQFPDFDWGPSRSACDIYHRTGAKVKAKHHSAANMICSTLCCWSSKREELILRHRWAKLLWHNSCCLIIPLKQTGLGRCLFTRGAFYPLTQTKRVKHRGYVGMAFVIMTSYCNYNSNHSNKSGRVIVIVTVIDSCDTAVFKVLDGRRNTKQSKKKSVLSDCMKESGARPDSVRVVGCFDVHVERLPPLTEACQSHCYTKKKLITKVDV